MDGVTARSLTPFERKAYTFYGMLLNAYRDEENMEPPVQKLSLQNGGDFTDDLAAMMTAMILLCSQFMPEAVKDMDLIGFTHMLNRVAIQHTFEKVMDQVDVFEDEE